MKSAALRVLLGLWLACWAALAGAEVAVPPLKARVTDLAATLQPADVATLEQQLAALEAKKGSQVAILIVPTTQPETVEQFALRVAESWKLGRKGVNDGALVLVAKNDRKLRIEVGYGLEGVIPDAVAKRIISETITPLFKQQQFHAGLAAGVEQIAKLLDGEALPPPPAKSEQSGQSGQSDEGGWWILLFFLAMGGARLARAIFGHFGGAALIGGAVGVAAWFFTQILLIGLVAGFVGFLISLLAASGSSGWSGGSGGGWSSGGSGSGGGFSGGGGDFGGGGASGDW